LPNQGIIQSTIFWLDKNNTSKKVKEQFKRHLKIIIEQNLFQYNDQFFKPKNGIAMGSPVSGTLAEIYLQHIEELYIRHWIESKAIIYCKRYVDDIIIIFNHNKTNEIAITSIMNNINEQLKFKATVEVNKSINYWDLTISRNINKIEISVYRKLTNANITIQYASNHPWDHKRAAFTHYINRELTLPITEQARTQEWEIICNKAQQNGFPIKVIQDIKEKEKAKQNKRATRKNEEETEQTEQLKNKKLVTFTYYSPLIRNVTNLFKNTGIGISFRASNNIYQQLVQKISNKNPSGIYEKRCNTCGMNYVGQSGRPVTTSHKEHIRYIKNNNPSSAYAVHILNNRHEYGTTENTLQLINPCRKISKMNHWENMYIQIYRQYSKLIEEEQVNEPNSLFEYAQLPHTLSDNTQQDRQQRGTHGNNTDR